MPHAFSRRQNGVGRIKTDPDSASDSNSFPESGTVNFSVHNNAPSAPSENSYSTYSHFQDNSSSILPVDRAFRREGRSDAPTPSERIADPEPLLKELRMRPGPATAVEVPSSDPSNFFQTSFQAIGKSLKAYNDTLGELQQLGVSHDVQLPELVLVGDQSAGKSSLMSGLANLELPRSEGTCTRCPLHIRVSRHNDLTCRVSLRKDYVYQTPERHVRDVDVTDEAPFFPWQKRPITEVHEFKTMNGKDQIEEALRWAQIAILNDDKNPELFVPGSGTIAQSVDVERASEQVAAKFSPNVVALEIKGPDLPDISFYDMPGIFQNPADASDEYLVNVVRNLSAAYIQHPSAIIICSMPMNSDAENSSTFGLARRLGALPRTIGVLTKADLIPVGGNHEQWLSIMRGEAHKTGHGYFITSRPQGNDLESLNKWEDRFFTDHSVEAWPESFWQFNERCGVEKLKAFLSERLGKEFEKSLPTIKKKVKSLLDKNNSSLAKLPELPANVELVVQTSLREFGDRAREQLRPEKLSKGFRSLTEDFRQCLLHIKPKFSLCDDIDKPVVEISDDDSDTSMTVVGNQRTPGKRRMGPPTTPSKRPRFEGTPTPGPPNGQVKHEENRGSLPPQSPSRPRPVLSGTFAKFSTIGSGFRTIRQVREEIQEKTRAGLPELMSESVHNDLCKAAIKPWEGPMTAFLTQLMHLLQSELEGELRVAFKPLNKRLIYQESRKLLKEYLDERRKEMEQALRVLYSLEGFSLFTINPEAFSRYRAEEETLLTRFRHQMRMEAASGSSLRRPPVPWESLTEEKRLQETKRRDTELAKIGPDPFRRELEVIGYVRGYYRLAALRFADNVALHVTNGMIPSIQHYLPHYLDGKLGLRGSDAQENYEKLMEEDDATATRRTQLKVEREKFEKALASIESLENAAGMDDYSQEYEYDEDAIMSGALVEDSEM